MNSMSRAWKLCAVGLFAITGLAACVVAGYDGGGGGVDVGYTGYVGGIYEPGGYEYGGWGRGYRVAPPRGGIHREGGRAAPSIPHGARGGGRTGGRAGGGRQH